MLSIYACILFPLELVIWHQSAYFMTNSEAPWKATLGYFSRLHAGFDMGLHCPFPHQISGAALAGALPPAPPKTRDWALVFLLGRCENFFSIYKK